MIVIHRNNPHLAPFLFSFFLLTFASPMSRFPIMFESAPFVNHFPYLVIFLLLILGGVGLPFPEDATLLLGGFLMAHYVIKPLPAFLVVYSGLLITDFSLYLVGKKYGRRVVEHKRFRKIISPT